MQISIIDDPRTLFIDAEKAEKDCEPLVMLPGRVRLIAERWHADQEKIAYLESLIIRIGRR